MDTEQALRTAALVYFFVGLGKAAITVPSLDIAVCEARRRSAVEVSAKGLWLSFFVATFAVSLVFWPLLLRTEGFKFFRMYTDKEVIDAVDYVERSHKAAGR